MSYTNLAYELRAGDVVEAVAGCGDTTTHLLVRRGAEHCMLVAAAPHSSRGRAAVVTAVGDSATEQLLFCWLTAVATRPGCWLVRPAAAGVTPG